MDILHSKLRTSPKDFFLYIATMVALYVSVFSLLALLFEYINILFPDALDRYVDPFSSQIRFSMSSLIIIFPLYVFLTRLVNKDLRENPKKKDINVRKWLIYLTLFVSGVAIVIDLITLVNTFLSGEITIRFILKILAVFVVVGEVFIYYLFDLRGRWETDEKLSKTIGSVWALIVFISIVSGFFVIGSPVTQRKIRLDQEKISDLQSIQYQITNYWRQKERLPNKLSDLEDPLIGYIAPKDPENNVSYEYNLIADQSLSFELCANFNKETDPKFLQRNKKIAPYGLQNENWEHTSGRGCFRRDIDPELLPPYKDDSINIPLRAQ